VPSTTQALAGEVALTPRREPLPLGPGLATRDQEVPFQCKISGMGPAGASTSPTAQASVAEVAATAAREDSVPGLGLATRDQAVPFQCKISV
jgi:hypothetical protein